MNEKKLNKKKGRGKQTKRGNEKATPTLWWRGIDVTGQPTSISQQTDLWQPSMVTGQKLKFQTIKRTLETVRMLKTL